MPLQATSLTLTPTWVNKGLTVAGSAPAVREKVLLRVVGAATAEGTVPAGFYVRIVPVGHPCTVYPPWHPAVATVPAPVEYARFPLAAADVWTVDGLDLTATLDLNTEALEDVFADTPVESQIEARVILESGSADNLYAVGRIIFRNWPQDGEDPIAGSSALKLRVDALETGLTAETDARIAVDDAETDARIAADDLLAAALSGKADSGSVLQEIADRTAAVQAEAAARVAADAALTNSISGLAETAALTAETAARVAADSAEAVARAGADAGLQVDIDTRATLTQLGNETSARTLADNALQAQINDKQGAPTSGALAAVAALAALPEEYTEADARLALNALIAAVKGLYA